MPELFEKAYEFYEDSEKFFQVIFDTAIDYAKLEHSLGGDVQGLITGFKPDGKFHAKVIDTAGDRFTPSFTRKINALFAKHGVQKVCVFDEAHACHARNEEERKEIQRFHDAGGSVEHWPTSEEVFYVEMTDGKNYQAKLWRLDRDKEGKYAGFTYQPERSCPFIPLDEEHMHHIQRRPILWDLFSPIGAPEIPS